MVNGLNIAYSANNNLTTQVGFPFNSTLPNANDCTYQFANDCDGVINKDLCKIYLEKPLANNTVVIGECEVEFLDKKGARSRFRHSSITINFCFQSVL